MNGFINYFNNAARPSPINLAVARVVLGVYVVWRVVSIDWVFYQQWPWALRNQPFFLDQEALLAILPYSQWVLVFLLVLFIVGFKIKWTAGFAGLLLAFMLSVKSTIYLSGTVESLFVCSYLLLLFAFFHTDDPLSIDGFSRTKHESLEALNDFLQTEEKDSYQQRPFKWGILVIGIMYIGSAWGKIMNGPMEIWLSGTDLQRDLLIFQEFTGVYRPLARPLIHFPELAWFGFVSTAIFQIGLLVAVLLGITVTPFILGLIGFHVMVAATMGLYFIDMIVVLMLFAAWDQAYSYLVTDREIELVYDEHCYICARSLYLFKLLDINDTITWNSQYGVSESHTNMDGVDLEEEMYVFTEDGAFGGYYAFQQLLKQFWFTLPVAWIMDFSPIATLGERIYQYIAENRNRYFVCSFD